MHPRCWRSQAGNPATRNPTQHHMSTEGSREDTTAASSPGTLPFPVVGIGASAGGLGALQQLLSGLPASPGMSFVIILHLSPDHESHAAEIFQRATKMPVQQVDGSTAIQVDQVYVIPPNKQLSMNDGHLDVAPLPPRGGRHVAIDLFFRTLALAHRERAIGIVLSGADSDGAVGLRSLKEHGGITLVQSPLDAEYDGMPRSAIATGMVDMVLPVEEMPQKLLDLWANARRLELPDANDVVPSAHEPTTPASAMAAEAALRAVLKLLHSRTGHDFTHYKRATLLRRLERRMQVTEQAELSGYRGYLESHPEETQALLQDLLISVTNFFRDREAFEALERAVAARLPQHAAGEGWRVWVPACATGEEAYSIAILMTEHMELRNHPGPLQVFATDLDERSIVVARAASYPESIAVDVPMTRLRRFFTLDQGRYVIKKAVRERVMFATHNLLRDPPFSRVDLISCRNLMIYLERDMQRRLLEHFHFALNPGGLLFLGLSEAAEVVSGLFEVVDKKHRLYRALPSSRVRATQPLVPQLPASLRGEAAVSPAAAAASGFEAVHQQLLLQHAPPSALIDGSGHIIHLSERAVRYFRYVAGAPTHHVLSAVLPQIRLELRTALFRARQSKERVEARRLRLERGGRLCLLNITVRPVPDAAGRSDLLLVLFDELETTLDDPTVSTDQGRRDPLVAELEAELQRLHEQLQGSIGDSETSSEELRASNEELQSMNEELRSATEELETSKEELQSVNEELITVNQELRTRVEDAAKVNDDLQNLIASTEIATVFVDASMRIKRFTPKAADVFNIIPADIGRSLLDITHRLDYDRLAQDAGATFDTLRVTEREVRANDGRSYLLRVLPYRTLEDRIEGAILTFVDITAARRAEESLRSGEARLRLVVESTRDFAIMTMDAQGAITSWNHGAERLFGWTEQEIIGQPGDVLFTPEDRERGVPADEMRRSREYRRAEDERWHQRKDGRTFYCSGVMTPLHGDATAGYAKIARDLTHSKITERRREAVLNAEQERRAALQAANALKDEFLAVLSHELKNPLNLIQVNAELLARLPEVRDVPAVERVTETIRRTVRSQAKIIDDLLDLSRVNTGKLALSLEPLALLPVVTTIVEAVRPDVERQQLTLSVRAPEPDLVVTADPVRIEQIVWNLVSNAMKFTPPGGSIEVALSREGVCARLEVIDTGRGLPAELVPRVFDMFRQEDAITTREHGGLGIGLALVKSLAELHKGRVEAASEGRDRGARFTVWLPLSETLAAPRSAPTDSVLDRLRVLIVDDAAEALDAFAMLLELHGAATTKAYDGPQALELAKGKVFDLLLSDVAMPGMDGHELLAQLRGEPQLAELPAIAITGFGRPQDAERALEAGFDAHIGKPVAMPTLVEILNGLRARGRLKPSL